MSDPFMGEIKPVAFNFPPKGWALCNGQLMPINQNQALFSLFGTQYGGDGRVNFALPNLRGRTPIGVGAGHTIGEAAGSESVTVNIQQLAGHIHALGVDTATATGSNVADPSAHAFGFGQATQTPGGPTSIGYFGSSADNAMATQSVTNSGGSQPHDNMQPYAVINFIVALQGIFPSQT